MWQSTENKEYSQTDGWNRLNLDAILDATIDRAATLATVELSALGLEMKKYIARHGAETSSRMAVYFFISYLVK